MLASTNNVAKPSHLCGAHVQQVTWDKQLPADSVLPRPSPGRFGELPLALPHRRIPKPAQVLGDLTLNFLSVLRV